jgi:transglutaminase-like putative cysteine protease
MRLARIHRRLAVLMSLASLLAFAGGAGLVAISAVLTALGLLLALFWQPSAELSAKMERIWLPVALLLVARALVHVFLIHDDVVIPVVDLLFLLLSAETLRSVDAQNDARIYSLSFALLLASTAYRPGLLFLLAFVAYVGLATVVLIVGYLRREGDRQGTGEIPVSRSFLLGSTALSAVTLSVAALVFLTFPRVSQGWEGRGETMATSIAGFADRVSLGDHGGRIYGNPQIVLRVEFPDGVPTNFQSLYWRGRSYDRFDGRSWSRSNRLPPSQAPPSWYERWGRDILRQRIYGAPLDTRVLFALHPLLDVETESRIQPISNNAGDHSYWGSAPPAYTAYSLVGRPAPGQLRTAEGGFVPARTFYTQLPMLHPDVETLADSLMRGLSNDYDRATSLVEWFQSEFTYSLNLPATAEETSLDHFLFHRRAGHCEYFSSAMVILLRTQGIPAREVNGFLGGSWSQFGDYLAVTQNEAHAWVEVWFPDFGWVPFDPTPAGRGEAVNATTWYWPGRFLFDAIQHRWNKWVLDYSFQTQFNLFERSREVVTGSNRLDPSPTDELAGRGRWGLIGWGVGILLALSALFWGTRNGAGTTQETRIFLRLKEACRRAGVPKGSLRSPMSITGYLESVRHPAAPAARRVVDGYLRARFSRLWVRAEEEREVRRALSEARAYLRRPAFKV